MAEKVRTVARCPCGELRHHEWEADDGSKQSKVEVNARYGKPKADPVTPLAEEDIARLERLLGSHARFQQHIEEEGL